MMSVVADQHSVTAYRALWDKQSKNNSREHKIYIEDLQWNNMTVWVDRFIFIFDGTAETNHRTMWTLGQYANHNTSGVSHE